MLSKFNVSEFKVAPAIEISWIMTQPGLLQLPPVKPGLYESYWYCCWLGVCEMVRRVVLLDLVSLGIQALTYDCACLFLFWCFLYST